MSGPSGGSPADYLAAERTFLAWIRTGLALMGFGFVVARFGLFLTALESGRTHVTVPLFGPSFWFGTGLIVVGVVVNILSTWSHLRLVRRLKRGESYHRPAYLAMVVSLLLATLGILMAVYLISVRNRGPLNAANFQEEAMASNAQNGIVTLATNHSVNQAVEKLESILEAAGIKLFTVIDHGGEAEKAGMQMRPAKVLIFGNPEAGTPLMVAAPTIAIDLPLKILVWEDTAGKTWITYNSPAYLQSRHALPAELARNIGAVEMLARRTAE